MTRCVDFYEKCTRDGFEWCEKSDTVLRYISKYMILTKEYPAMARLPERTVRPLFKIRDPFQVKEAVSTVENALFTPTGVRVIVTVSAE